MDENNTMEAALAGHGAQDAARQEAARAERTFTQADVDRLIRERLARANRDAAQRIESARQEGYSEAEDRVKAAEAAREQADIEARAREASLEQREREIERRELRGRALETLRERRLPARLAEVLDYTDAEACERSIGVLDEVLREAVREGIEARVGPSRSPIRRAPTGDAALMAHVRSAMGL